MFNSCRGCSERTPGCHDICENYQRERAEYEKRKKELKGNAEYELYVHGKCIDRVNAEVKAKQRRRRWCRRGKGVKG